MSGLGFAVVGAIAGGTDERHIRADERQEILSNGAVVVGIHAAGGVT